MVRLCLEGKGFNMTTQAPRIVVEESNLVPCGLFYIFEKGSKLPYA